MKSTPFLGYFLLKTKKYVILKILFITPKQLLRFCIIMQKINPAKSRLLYQINLWLFWCLVGRARLDVSLSLRLEKPPCKGEALPSPLTPTPLQGVPAYRQEKTVMVGCMGLELVA